MLNPTPPTSPVCIKPKQTSSVGLPFLFLGLVPQWLCDPVTAKETQGESLLGLLGKLLLPPKKVMLDGHDV